MNLKLWWKWDPGILASLIMQHNDLFHFDRYEFGARSQIGIIIMKNNAFSCCGGAWSSGICTSKHSSACDSLLSHFLNLKHISELIKHENKIQRGSVQWWLAKSLASRNFLATSWRHEIGNNIQNCQKTLHLFRFFHPGFRFRLGTSGGIPKLDPVISGCQVGSMGCDFSVQPNERLCF